MMYCISTTIKLITNKLILNTLTQSSCHFKACRQEYMHTFLKEVCIYVYMKIICRTRFLQKHVKFLNDYGLMQRVKS